MEHSCSDTDSGKSKHPDTNLSQSQFFHQKPTWIGLVSIPDHLGGWPANTPVVINMLVNSVSTSRRTHFSSIIEPNPLTLFSDIIVVYCDNHRYETHA